MRRAGALWLRRFGREPASTAFLMLSVAVTLAGVIVALSLNSAVLWRALPFDAADRIVTIEPHWRAAQRQWLTMREFRALAEAPPAPFRFVAGYTAADFIAQPDRGQPAQPLLATLVAARYFDVFQLHPAIGELPDADRYAADERVVLMSDEFWARRYGRSPDLIGRSIPLSGPDYLQGSSGAYRVIGVLPRETWLFWKRADIVLPLRYATERAGDPAIGVIEHVVARLRDDSSLAAARAAMPAAVARLQASGAMRPPDILTIEGLQAAHFRQLRPHMLIVLVVAVSVLALALLNLALAAVAHALESRRESAIRIALGASTLRLFTAGAQHHAITALLAGAAAGALGAGLTPAVASFVPNGWLNIIPGQAGAIRIDVTVSLIVTGILIAAVMVGSTATQLVINRVNPWLLIANAHRELTASHRIRSLLVCVEVALCATAVGVGTELSLRLHALNAVDLGIASDRVFAVWLNVRPESHPGTEARSAYYSDVLQRVRNLPGVESVGAIDLTFQFDWQTTRVRTDVTDEASTVTALDRAATADYLGASGVRLVAGRWFDERDRVGGAPTAVVSETLARTLAPDGSVLGRTITLAATTGPPAAATVVGIVSDTRHAPHAPTDRIVYRSALQVPPPWLYLIVRARPDASNVASTVAATMRGVDPTQSIEGPWPLADWVAHLTEDLRFVTWLTALLAIIGALLCAAGLYALSHCWVTESRHELGVRRAVGASDRQVMRWFGRRWIAVVVPGLGLGALLQSVLMRALVSQIAGVERTASAPVLALGALSLCAIAGAAVPFHHALKSDAAVLLRQG